MNTPVIKGIFVNSHIKAVEQTAGDEGLQRLERCFGKAMTFRNSEDVPVADEVKLIECALDVVSKTKFDGEERAFEAGRLHFRNFVNTPFAKIIFSTFRKNYKTILMNARHIAGHIFHGVEFSSVELGPTSVQVTMKNGTYPVEHFRGLFYEWMLFSGYSGTVEGEQKGPSTYVYTATWQKT